MKPTAPKPDRLAVLAKIEEYERLGGEYFFCDVEDDPPAPQLRPEDVDYLYRGYGKKVRRFGAIGLRNALAPTILKQMFDLKIEGEEHLKNLTGGAVFTSNHFAPFENLCVREASRLVPGKHRFFCVIREGNYAMEGLFGFLLRNCDTLPLSSCLHTMANFNRAVTDYLKEGAHILIYPEQAMWYRYRKPRPYRIGAFHIAAKSGVPVVPCFMTSVDREELDGDGFPRRSYTLHVLPPIYPDADKSAKENAAWMRERNATLTRETYERVYGIPLTYGDGQETGDDFAEEFSGAPKNVKK